MTAAPWHALARYRTHDDERLALVLGQPEAARLHDLGCLLDLAGEPAAHPLRAEMTALLVDWPARSRMLAALAARADTLGAPVLERPPLVAPLAPGRIFAAASNYHEHAREMGTRLAERSELAPYFFMKADSAVIGPGAPIRRPAQTAKLDWEIELAAVIGTGARNLAVGDALAHVAGYTVLNDISARDLNRRTDYPFTHDWFRGKSWDSFAPMGPWMVPAGCIPDPQRLRLRLAVNGTTMQDDTTAAMIFSIAEQIAYLSTILTLRAGDVIATGTPTGVGMGRGVYLEPGDAVEATIESIGTLANPVVAA